MTTILKLGKAAEAGSVLACLGRLGPKPIDVHPDISMLEKPHRKTAG